MKDKISQVCDYILDRLESGEYRSGETIPSARKIEKTVDASFAMIQHAVTTLAQAGILHCVNRQGSIVRENWRDGLLPGNLVLFDPCRPWVSGFRNSFRKDFRISGSAPDFHAECLNCEPPCTFSSTGMNIWILHRFSTRFSGREKNFSVRRSGDSGNPADPFAGSRLSSRRA